MLFWFAFQNGFEIIDFYFEMFWIEIKVCIQIENGSVGPVLMLCETHKLSIISGTEESCRTS